MQSVVWTDTALGVLTSEASGFKLRTWRAGPGYWGYSIGDGGTLETTGRMYGGDEAGPPPALLPLLHMHALVLRGALDAHRRATLAATLTPAPTT